MKIEKIDHSQKTISAAIGYTTEEFDALKDKLKKFIKDNYKKESFKNSYFIEGLLKEFSYSEVILIASFYCSNLIEELEKKKAEKMMKSIENDPILSLFKDIFGDRAFVTRISKNEFLKAKEDSEKTDNKSDILRQIEDLKNKKRNSDEEDDGN